MYRIVFVTALAACLTMAGCSSSSDGVPAPSSFSGQLLIPAGPAAQTVGGLIAVADATLELIRVDEFGAPTGEVLATTTTDANGDYTIDLPAGVTFGPDLIVRASGGPADGLRALVTQAQTDIDPTSEYPLRELTTGGNTLANVTAGEVNGLLALLGEFPVDGGDTIEDAISDIDERATETVGPVIETAVQEEGDTSLIAGEYHFIQFGFELDTSVASRHFADSGSFSIMSGSEGSGQLDNYVVNEFELSLFAGSNGNGGASYNLVNDSDDVNDDPPLPLQFAADGSLIVLVEAEEEIDQNSGSRSPAAAHTLYPAGDAFFGAIGEEENIYGLTPGNELDLTNQLARSIGHNLFLTARKAAISNATIDGSVFGYITIGELYEANGDRELFADLGTYEFSSSSATSGTALASDDIISLFRNVNPNDLLASVAWGATGANVDDPIGEDDGTETVQYTLDPATGAVTMTLPQATVSVDGFFANSGTLMVLREVFGQEEAENSIGFGVKLGTANPSVDGSYRVIALQKGFTGSGATMINRHANTEMRISGTAVSVDLPDRVSSRADDLATEIATFVEAATEAGTMAFTGTNGQASMLIEGSKLSGFFSADGSMGIFRFADSDFIEGDEGAVGMVILIRK
ncbi:MAG: hypothetical protein ACYTEG_02775 [Planctomycetota bacterium]